MSEPLAVLAELTALPAAARSIPLVTEVQVRVDSEQVEALLDRLRSEYPTG